ncbi:MAG: hypothetical protein GDA44_12290 [Prochloron sp. SP5CPC1]|nr:hypothetical protein [Candidatus Paraprochloron terpiosi SP5CPC1]
MNKTILAALHLAAAGQLLLVKPAGAIIFNFNWTSDAPGLIVSGAATHTATGTVDINGVNPGGRFVAANVSNVDLTVTDGTNTVNLNKNDFVYWDGYISPQGDSVLTEDFLFEGFRGSNTLNRIPFLNYIYTRTPEDDILMFSDISIHYVDLSYVELSTDSRQAGQNSFVITAEPVPFGILDYLPIGFLG